MTRKIRLIQSSSLRSSVDNHLCSVFGDEVNIDKWLAQFKEIKNHNYDKFTDRIFGNLQKGTFSFHAALDRFILISNKANE